MNWTHGHLIKEALAEIADNTFHSPLWRGESVEIGSAIEAYSQLFDDSGLGDALESGTVFDAAIDERLRQLDTSLRALELARVGTEELLADPRFRTISERAAEVLFMIIRFEAASSRGDQAN